MEQVSKIEQLNKKEHVVFTSNGGLISGGSVERQFYPDVYISHARTAVLHSITPLKLSKA